MIELDKYAIKARLYPTFIVLLPAFLTGLFYVTNFEKYYHYFTAIISVSLFTFLLSQLGRDRGKRKEPSLFKYFGGKPTTQILRHQNSHIDRFTKERYHNALSLKIGIPMPSYEQEFQDPNIADETYESCVRFLLSKTRDKAKFKLLFNENINYGFRRNLWGMKSWGIAIIFICIFIHFFLSTKNINQFSLKDSDIILFVFYLISLMFWTIVVTREWIKVIAFVYAERLLETIEEI